MSRSWMIVVSLFLSGCRAAAPVPPIIHNDAPDCVAITAHAEGEAPSCQALIDAFERGRVRVVKLYPAAAGVAMSTIYFYRPHLVTVYDKPYPLFDSLNGLGPGEQLVRGTTSPTGPVFIEYAYEDVVEHEAVHALMRIVAGDVKRTQDAIDASTPDQQAEFLWMESCHGTPDDPYGERGNIASCLRPFTAPGSSQ